MNHKKFFKISLKNKDETVHLEQKKVFCTEKPRRTYQPVRPSEEFEKGNRLSVILGSHIEKSLMISYYRVLLKCRGVEDYVWKLLLFNLLN